MMMLVCLMGTCDFLGAFNRLLSDNRPAMLVSVAVSSPREEGQSYLSFTRLDRV